MSTTTLALQILVTSIPDDRCVAPAALSLGLQSGPSTIVPGTAEGDDVRFDLEVRVKPGRDGSPDFAGPLVHGKVGDRFLYLSWGRSDPDCAHAGFRRLKIYLSPVVRKNWSSPGLSWAQIHAGERVHVTVDGQLGDGTPNCGTAHALWLPA